jgi:hypothetical protein
MRFVALLAELNGLEMQAADVGDACLEALISKKVCFIAGPEFGERAGHTLIVHKALHGLRTSGARWGEKFADALSIEGFFPCRADPCVWMRDAGDTWECMFVRMTSLFVWWIRKLSLMCSRVPSTTAS